MRRSLDTGRSPSSNYPDQGNVPGHGRGTPQANASPEGTAPRRKRTAGPPGGHGLRRASSAIGPAQARADDTCRTAATSSLPTGRNRRRPENSRTPIARVLVRGFVLRDDVRGNAPALIDLVSALLRPLPDLSAALTAGPSTRPAAAGRRACFACVLHIVGKVFTELARVAGTQIDLIRGSVESKRYGLCRLAPIEIVDEKHLYLLCHGFSPSDGATYFGC